MTFNNPIVGGNGTLVREQIKSENYAPGLTGWIIRRDGTFELSGGTFRGTIVITDPDGSQIELIADNGAKITFRPDTVAGVTTDFLGEVAVSYFGNQFNGYAAIMVNGPEVTANGNSLLPASLLLAGEYATGAPWPDMDDVGTYMAWNGSARIGQQLIVGTRLNNDRDGMTYVRGQVGVANVNMGAAGTTFTVNVVFPDAFPVGVVPSMSTPNIRQGAAAGQLWTTRAINITNTGFTIVGSRSGAAVVLASDIDWQAFIVD